MSQKAQNKNDKLSKQQKKREKKKRRNQRVVVKNVLENPFAIDLSYVDEEYEKEVVNLLESSCQDLQVPICKPPWEKVQSLRGEERKKYIKAFKKRFAKRLQLDRKYAVIREARSHLVFGYNEVMRALERNSLAGILVKRESKPSFVVETFLPGCINKCIPLVPVTHLDQLIQNENTLAVKYSVLVLGLKSSVKEEQNRFFPLYEKMTRILEDMLAAHKAVNVHHSTEADDSHEKDKSAMSEVKEESVGVDASNPLEIQNYHLKRLNEDERVFIPRNKKARVDELDIIPIKDVDEETGFNWDLIPVKADNKGSNFLGEQKPFLGAFRNKKPEAKRTSATPASANLNFYLDTSGDTKEDIISCVTEMKAKAELEGIEVNTEETHRQNDAGKISAPGSMIKKIENKGQVAGVMEKEKSIQMKKLEPSISYSYIEGKTKRIKNNPNREDMKNQ